MSADSSEDGRARRFQLARIRVSPTPLKKGEWEGVNWKKDQDTRCSNNFLTVAPDQPEPVPCERFTWVVESEAGDPNNNVVFDVVLDVPDEDDKTLVSRAANGNTTPSFLASGKPGRFERGVYIVTRNASAPYIVILRGE
jgi:hypothetical protein